MDNISAGAAEPNVWVDVNLAALKSNASLLLRQLAASDPAPELIAVVKADGYGHGAVAAATAFRSVGVRRFAVTSLDEASALVAGGIDPARTPVLVFAPVVTKSQAWHLCDLGLEATVCDANHVRLLAAASGQMGRTLRVHLKVDTGMARLGESPKHALGVARLIEASEGVVLAGTYTHFATAADADLAGTRTQLDRLMDLYEAMRREGISPGLRHAANSAASLRLPESHLDAVRLGTVLYGQSPSKFVPHVDGLDPQTWSVKARVIFVRDLPTGATIGYGAEETLRKRTRAASLAIGFADGFGMTPSSMLRGRRGLRVLLRYLLGNDRPFVLLHGQRAPVLGRIAMQMVVVDVSGFPSPVKSGDIAEIPMRRLAASARLPRLYHE